MMNKFIYFTHLEHDNKQTRQYIVNVAAITTIIPDSEQANNIVIGMRDDNSFYFRCKLARFADKLRDFLNMPTLAVMDIVSDLPPENATT